MHTYPDPTEAHTHLPTSKTQQNNHTSCRLTTKTSELQKIFLSECSQQIIHNRLLTSGSLYQITYPDQNTFTRILISEYSCQNANVRILISELLHHNTYIRILVAEYSYQITYIKIFISKYLCQNTCIKILTSECLYQNTYIGIFISEQSKQNTCIRISRYLYQRIHTNHNKLGMIAKSLPLIIVRKSAKQSNTVRSRELWAHLGSSRGGVRKLRTLSFMEPPVKVLKQFGSICES